LRHNEILEFSRVEYHGAIRAEDLHNHAAFNADNPIWLGFDCISVIHADLDIAEISLANLDGVFNAHRQAVRAAWSHVHAPLRLDLRERRWSAFARSLARQTHPAGQISKIHGFPFVFVARAILRQPAPTGNPANRGLNRPRRSWLCPSP
jgi:hypothetical protein